MHVRRGPSGKLNIERIESFEMWCVRKILKMKWTDYKGMKISKGNNDNIIGLDTISDLKHDALLLKTLLEGKYSTLEKEPVEGNI